jgi:hypothetical protein
VTSSGYVSDRISRPAKRPHYNGTHVLSRDRDVEERNSKTKTSKASHMDQHAGPSRLANNYDAHRHYKSSQSALAIPSSMEDEMSYYNSSDGEDEVSETESNDGYSGEYD